VVIFKITGFYIDKHIKVAGAKEFGSFAFASALGYVSRKSKCAKLAVAVNRRIVMVDSILTN
jgi:hypothetical protein